MLGLFLEVRVTSFSISNKEYNVSPLNSLLTIIHVSALAYFP